MSLPPLPREIESHVLADLQHIVSPPPVAWHPAAPGWLWLAVTLLALVLYWCGLRLRRWGRNRYRREAVRILHGLGAVDGSPCTVASINRVLKLAALAAWPRERVAPLSGRSWVNFLNNHCPGAPFDTRQLSLLAAGAYQHQSPAPDELRRLTAAAALWIMCHKGPADV